jgi:hypothetical protein
VNASCLNLSALRRVRAPGHITRHVSRRAWLSMAGSGAVMASPGLKTIGSLFLDRFEFRKEQYGGSFCLDGRERWVIDTRRFAGTPRFSTGSENGDLVLTLAGARFAGTAIPADFQCRISPAQLGSHIEIRFSFAGLHGRTAFEPWLAGREPLHLEGDADIEAIAFGQEGTLNLAGAIDGRFSPAWHLQLEGHDIVRLSLSTATLSADACLLSLPALDSPSALKSPSAARTRFSVDRGGAAWSIVPLLHTGESLTFSAAQDTFDTVDIESSERRRGAVQHAIVADARRTDAPLLAHLTPPSSLRHSFQGALPLVLPRYAIGYSGASVESTLFARFADTPVWLNSGGMGIEVGGGAAARPFECLMRDGRVASLRCSPALLRTLVPVHDAIVEPSPVRSGRTMDLGSIENPDDEPQKTKTTQSQTTQTSQPQKTQTSQTTVPAAANPLLLNNRVSVLRPEDFVKIDFEFRNLKIQGGGIPVVVKDKSGSPAYLIAHLPPQHIAEQAYFEVDKSKFPIKDTPGKPADPDKTKNSDEDPPDPPIPSRISGPSRIAFLVSSNAAPIEYSLKGLLSACATLPLSVSFPAGALTKAQQQYFKSLQLLSNFRNGIAGARQAAGDMRVSLEDVTKKASSASLKSGAKALNDNIQVLRASPQNVAMNPWVLKRIETLHNAATREAAHDPLLAAEHAKALENLLSGIDTSLVPGAFQTGALDAIAATMLKPAAPGETETALEVPYRLILSPNNHAGWIHRSDVVTSNGRTELWHTRLGVRDPQGNVSTGMDRLRTLRAIWSPDFSTDPHSGPGHIPMIPYRMALDRQDRHEIVHLTSGFPISNFEPLPVQAEMLLLSALGAWTNVVGDWVPPATAGLSVEHWRNRGTMGRDHFVRVVYAGFLYPFGHKASLVKITERKFQLRKLGFASKPVLVAYLRQRMYIIIKEREKSFPGPGQDAMPGGSQARKMPFRRIRVTTLVTPNLDKPENSCVKTEGQSAFWPFVGGTPFAFHCVGDDWEGRSAEFTANMLFVDQGVAFSGTRLSDAQTEYMKWVKRRESALQGQRIAYADPTVPGDTSFETESITFGGEVNSAGITTLAKDVHPPFYPTVEQASVHVSPAEQLLGSATPQTIVLDPAYIGNGFDGDKNKGEVFAALKNGLMVDFAGDSRKSGGLVTPSMSITGLSRSVGAFGGTVAEMAKGNFQPMDYFKAVLSEAKILGGIPLYTLIDAIPDFSGSPGRVPRIATESSPEYLRTIMTWNPRLRTSSAPSGSADEKFADVFVPNDPDGGMTVTVDMRAPLTGGQPQATVRTEIKNFTLRLIPSVAEFMNIEFNRAVFTITPGNKVDIDVDIKDLRFAGALSFVNQILLVVPKSGFSDPPFLEVSTSGIVAGYSLGIPTIAVGACSLQNINLGARLGIPFNGKPLNVGFDFCTRENPFLLTVSLFGGGGFFGITVSPKGVEVLEASLEFGGAFALNLGVAKGGVVVMGGFYFMKSSDVTHYEAYVRVAGAVAILGLITLSIEFYVGLSYSSNGKMEGVATVKVKIEIAFFSKTVSMTVKRQFKGSAGDPLFKDTMSPDDYGKYLSAFAAD